ncbi:TetR/AcrR family transcriptional regulator [Gorillibacterium timonense]|uniref:TetR/AcrR family transcriptional regulator n=1 Tax=Gorillibacterium timonense TaxID=1689269 RepID=UPI00071D686A|nr:TetR/AcrR family transcriptional regulator [Gorillibacterium timonense]
MEPKDRVRTPRQERSMKTKTLILHAAIQLFSEKGYHATNTKEIAAAAGVSTGSVYSYYADKRAIFLDAVLLYNREFVDRMERELSEIDIKVDDKRMVLPTLVDSLISAHQVFKSFHNEMKVLYYSDPVVRHLMDEQYERSREMTLKYFNNWKDELILDDPEAAAFVVFEAIGQVVDMLVFSKVPISEERIKKGLIAMVESYLMNLDEKEEAKG